MPEFNDRERAHEKKFELDQELEFKAMARRNKLLGLWAAEHMGLKGPEADAYAKEVVAADFAEAGDEDVFRKVRGDLDAKKVDVSDHLIRAHMAEFLVKAREQVRAGG
jgi:hypothetical protein